MKKVTVLLGAGAAIPWNAPATSTITNAFKNSTDHIIDQETLGIWMDRILIQELQYPRLSVNFETYVDFMESVSMFLLGQDKHLNYSMQSSLYKLFELRNDITEGIKNLIWSNHSTFSSDAIKALHSFYSLIRIIGNQVIPYLNNYEKKDISLNNKLLQFYEHFITVGYSVRAYTLNYDRSIPLVFESASSRYDIFDGFDITNTYADNNMGDLYLLNRSKVINDTQCHSFYNLHGSFHWSFQDADYKVTRSTIPFTIMSTKKYKYYPSSFVEEYFNNTNPNEKIFPTNIITGYRKTQRANLEPFNFFYHSFFHDIYQSEIIIVVGYSYSDPHINHLLKEAMRRNTKIYNISFRQLSPEAIKNGYTGFEGMVLKNNYPDYTKWFREAALYFSEYPNGFTQFLEDEEWFNILPVC